MLNFVSVLRSQTLQGLWCQSKILSSKPNRNHFSKQRKRVDLNYAEARSQYNGYRLEENHMISNEWKNHINLADYSWMANQTLWPKMDIRIWHCLAHFSKMLATFSAHVCKYWNTSRTNFAIAILKRCCGECEKRETCSRERERKWGG